MQLYSPAPKLYRYFSTRELSIALLGKWVLNLNQIYSLLLCHNKNSAFCFCLVCHVETFSIFQFFSRRIFTCFEKFFNVAMREIQPGYQYCHKFNPEKYWLCHAIKLQNPKHLHIKCSSKKKYKIPLLLCNITKIKFVIFLS